LSSGIVGGGVISVFEENLPNQNSYGALEIKIEIEKFSLGSYLEFLGWL
jgi:hypothetical protein